MASLLLLASLRTLASLCYCSWYLYVLYYSHRTVIFFCYWTIGLSNIGLANSRNYRTIGYRIKATIYRTIGYRTHKKLSVAHLCNILFCQAFFQSAQNIYGKREGSIAGSGSIPLTSGSGSIPLTSGSRSGRPKNMRIQDPDPQHWSEGNVTTILLEQMWRSLSNQKNPSL